MMNIPFGMTVAQFIIDLANKNGVSYVKTNHDALAEVITHLSDDDVEQDDICDLLLALNRKSVIAKSDWMDLLHAYLAEKYRKSGGA